jgi:tyrosine-protein phosphatase non-receptor type 23
VAIKNGPFRETGNIEYTRQRKTKQKHNTICVGHHNAQINILLDFYFLSSSNGIGRTGTFLMIYTGMQEIDHGNGIVNIQTVAKKMLQQRRYVIREKSQLKFCYEAILYHAQDILAKRKCEY